MPTRFSALLYLSCPRCLPTWQTCVGRTCSARTRPSFYDDTSFSSDMADMAEMGDMADMGIVGAASASNLAQERDP